MTESCNESIPFPTLYCRLEPTIYFKVPCTNQSQQDTVFYSDRDMKLFVDRWPWYHTKQPMRRGTVTLKGVKYLLVWVRSNAPWSNKC